MPDSTSVGQVKDGSQLGETVSNARLGQDMLRM